MSTKNVALAAITSTARACLNDCVALRHIPHPRSNRAAAAGGDPSQLLPSRLPQERPESRASGAKLMHFAREADDRAAMCPTAAPRQSRPQGTPRAPCQKSTVDGRRAEPLHTSITRETQMHPSGCSNSRTGALRAIGTVRCEASNRSARGSSEPPYLSLFSTSRRSASVSRRPCCPGRRPNVRARYPCRARARAR